MRELAVIGNREQRRIDHIDVHDGASSPRPRPAYRRLSSRSQRASSIKWRCAEMAMFRRDSQSIVGCPLTARECDGGLDAICFHAGRFNETDDFCAREVLGRAFRT